MGKRYWNSFLNVMGYFSIIYLIASLIFQNSLDLRDMQMGMLIGIFGYSAAFFTFELKLFSKSLWVRRAIVIAATVVFMVTVNLLYYRNISKGFLVAIGAGVGVVIIGSVLLYYINDKIEERRLEAINKMLEKNQTTDDTQNP